MPSLFCNGRLVAKNAEVAGSYLKKLKGLLGVKGIADDYAMLIPGCNSVHTFFMKTSIDVVMTDKSGAAVYLRENMEPWRLAGCLKARDTVEMKAGGIKAKGIKAGDILSIE